MFKAYVLKDKDGRSIPVVKLPPKMLADDASPEDKAMLATIKSELQAAKTALDLQDRAEQAAKEG